MWREGREQGFEPATVGVRAIAIPGLDRGLEPGDLALGKVCTSSELGCLSAPRSATDSAASKKISLRTLRRKHAVSRAVIMLDGGSDFLDALARGNEIRLPV